MSFSSMDRDGFSRFPNGQYGSMPISNGGGGSPVSSPAEESPEATFKPTRFHAGNNGSHLGDEAKLRKPQVRYRECQKNHAASIGGHAIDGCGEFLPSGKEGTLEALKCAACFCHRNFHRREFVGSDGEYACSCGAAARSQALSGPFALNQSLRPMSPGVREAKGHQLPSSADISPHAHMVMPLAQFDDDDDDDDDDDEPPQHPRPGSSKKKRFRTKFTTEQKEKMLHFAEILGWKISRHDEDAVQEFCNDVRVKRNVFKVWMHNNKHSSGKKQGGGSEVGRNCDSPPEY